MTRLLPLRAPLSAALLASLLASCAATRADQLGPIPPVDISAPTVGERVTAEELRADVDVLASDEYGGRGTLEDGEAKAAAYLADAFRDIGLSPLPGEKDFRVAAALERTGFDKDATRAILHVGERAIELKGGVDFQPFWFSRPGAVKADVVFAGYGISRPEMGYDDYAGLDVEGKVVFVLRHTPPKSKDRNFDRTRDGYFATKAQVARDRGAVGMLLVTDPRSYAGAEHGAGEDLRMSWRLSVPKTAEEKAEAEKRRRAVEARSRAAANREGAAGKSAPITEERIAAIHVSTRVGGALADALGRPLSEIQKILDTSGRGALAFEKPVRLELEVGAEIEGGVVHATNVVGFLPGSDSRLRDQWIVVGAHYDHLGRFEGRGDTIYNGADDNASGTSAMLAVARRLATGPRPRRSVVFVGFSAEEKGLLGSQVLARGPLGPERVAFMINMDMLGRNGDKPVYVGGDGYARGLADIVRAANTDLELELELGGSAISGNSDHAPFFRRGIPVLNLFTGLHEDYHQLEDHAHKLDYVRMARIATLATRVARTLASAPEVPAFIYRPLWLGAALEERKAGPARVAGWTLTEVEEGSRAARAGLAVGDVVVRIGDQEASMEALDGVEPGTRATLSYRRDGQIHTASVTRARRGFLGVWPRGVEAAVAKKLGLGDDQGVLIAGVTEGGPAAKVGIRQGDILVEIAGKPVGPRNLGARLARIGAGEKVPVLLIRNGQRESLTMVLGERPSPAR